MPDNTYEPDPDVAADDELAAERLGQSTTAEEAMDAATHEEGFADESAYTPSTGDQNEAGAKDAHTSEDPGLDVDPDVSQQARAGLKDASQAAGAITQELDDATEDGAA